ncbi:FtsX-like permease family protein [Actinoplanes sp. GCM10030250]|uniref:FtsX-like permease family protein n=1 Tax=Actinoplanes sp. GCM10030250 TaxID=3273376 RepID=UPI003623B1A5
MLRMSGAGLAERMPLFAGAVLSVCLGVALVQSSLLLLITAATMDPPPGLDAAGRMLFDDARAASVSMLGVVMGCAAFLAVFIISSTFAFTVDQRRRDLALLRLVGGSRGQLRRLLLGEAVLLGGLGAALGIPAGLGVMAVQSWLMRTMGFVPDSFRGEWRMWIIGASIGTGLVLAVSGAMTAAHRAARVRPLEALRDSGEAARVMTAGRWVAGLFFLAGAAALIIVAPYGGPAGGMAMAMNAPLCAAVAVAAFSPLLVPAVARLIPAVPGPLSSLARANLRDGRRRSASVAAPVMVLVALVVGQAGVSTSFTTAGIAEQRRLISADLVVESAGPIGDRAAAVPGVAAASAGIAIPGRAAFFDGEEWESDTISVLVVDPAAYAAVHPGSELHGITGGPGGDIGAGSARIELPDLDLGEVAVTGVVPVALSGGPDVLMPRDRVPEAMLASAPSTTLVRLQDGADRSAVSAALAAHGRVTTVDRWLAADARERSSTSDKIMVLILGLGSLYALVGVVNAVVIGAAARRREFAEARVTGLSRIQVVRSALTESTAVTMTGVILGLAAATVASLSIVRTTEAVTGTATLDPPWLLLAGVAVLTLAATSLTSVFTSLSATRERPIALLGARE